MDTSSEHTGGLFTPKIVKETEQNTDMIQNANCNVTRRAKRSLALTASRDDSGPVGRDGNSRIIEELKLHMSELFHEQMVGILDAITDLTNSIKTQNLRIEQIEARVTALENKSEEVHAKEISTLEKAVAQLQVEISDRDQALLINDLEISGCPEIPNENCVHLVMSIANKVGVQLDERDIVSAERTGRVRSGEEDDKSTRTRPLAVRLARREKRDSLLRAARVRRLIDTDGMQLPGPAHALYINERLTKSNRLLFHRARMLARDLKYKFVWTRDGRIYVRQDTGMKGHRIHSEADLLQVFGKL